MADLCAELGAYATELAEKPEILVLSKSDAAPADYIEDLKAELMAQGVTEIMVISSVSGEGVKAVLRRLYSIITDSIEAEKNAATPQKGGTLMTENIRHKTASLAVESATRIVIKIGSALLF